MAALPRFWKIPAIQESTPLRSLGRWLDCSKIKAVAGGGIQVASNADCCAFSARVIMASLGLVSASAAPQNSPAGVNVTQLCNSISSQITISPPTPNIKYQHQEIMRNAAGVAENDPPETVRSKMQAFWMANRQSFRCNQLGFSVRDGNIVTLIIERDSREAFNDFVRRWRLDVNFIDPATGMTMLEFVEAEIIRTRGTSNEVQNKIYRDILLRNGAKKASEL